MIFEYMRFNNYRPYYGIQTLDFRNRNVVSKNIHNKNIVLVGGLNGHGKTSLINSIFVCLFGHRKFKNLREYGDYLSKSVNTRYLKEGGREGSVELAFTDETGTYAIEVVFVVGHQEEFRKVYQLDNKLEKIREIQFSAEEFYDFIDTRIPLDVSQFFIFDAEKIRDLVGEQESEETIRAIQKVVSLELYNQLLKDIDKIYSEMTREIKNKTNDREIETLFEELEKVSDQIEALETKHNEVNEKIEVLSNQEQEKQRERRILIAQSSLTKQSLSKAIGENMQILNQIQQGLKNSRSTQLPMLILQPRISDLKARLKKEKNYLDAKLREKANFSTYEDFMSELLNQNISPILTGEQKEQLKRSGKTVWAKINNLQNKLVSEKIDILHDLSQGDFQKLIYYPETKSTTLKDDISKKQKIETLLKKYQDQFGSAPEEVDTHALDEIIANLNQNLGKYRGEKRDYFSSLNKLRQQKFTLNNNIKSKQKDLEKLGPLESKLDLLERLRNGTKEFIDQVTVLKSRLLKDEIETIIGQLFRKKDFQKVEFHPEKFTLEIYDQFSQRVDLMSRSEGEKQLIALAMIWALTKVSGSNFPFVIDTPLARLDSIHRSNLVNHYFTKLSEQVVILSTDTEITKDFYQELLPFIEREYILDFNEDTKCTSIEEGYFFEKELTTWQM